jgi:hypothetical protein
MVAIEQTNWHLPTQRLTEEADGFNGSRSVSLTERVNDTPPRNAWRQHPAI